MYLTGEKEMQKEETRLFSGKTLYKVNLNERLNKYDIFIFPLLHSEEIKDIINKPLHRPEECIKECIPQQLM